MYSLGSINGKILPTKGKEIHVSSALSGAAISQVWSVLLPRGLHLHSHVYMITASSHVLRKAQLSPHVADYGLQLNSLDFFTKEETPKDRLNGHILL